ncbi:MAG: uracil-DNA glycosylase family protein [Halolamina sp.]
MKNVTDRTSNPFGMRPPCAHDDPSLESAVFGYGDANADFHLIGDHPGVHGGETTGVPFTETDSGEAIGALASDLEFASGPRDRPDFENLVASYLHMCTLPDGRTPTDEEYADLERYFDAELRAINAHILMPVGARATDHVLTEYTTQRRRLELDMAALHAREIRGRGFLVVPIQDPIEWESGDREAIRSTLEDHLNSDYRQTKGVATLVG